jgi:hypothetical protein
MRHIPHAAPINTSEIHMRALFHAMRIIHCVAQVSSVLDLDGQTIPRLGGISKGNPCNKIASLFVSDLVAAHSGNWEVSFGSC